MDIGLRNMFKSICLVLPILLNKVKKKIKFNFEQKISKN